MRLEIYNPGNTPLPPELDPLIRRIRAAAAKLHLQCTLKLEGGSTFPATVGAWVHGHVEHVWVLDFKAYTPGVPNGGHADIGPMVPLGESLFEGDHLAFSIIKKMVESFSRYAQG